MYNRVILMGNLTKDPELRTTPSGTTMCRISIAVNRSYAKPGQERQTDFFNVTCWGQQAEFVCKYFNRGRMIHIEGRIQNDNYTDQNGNKVYRDQIIAERVDFCGNKNDNAGNYGGGQQYDAPQQNYGGGYNGGGNSYGGNSYGGQQQNTYQQPQTQSAPAPQAAFNNAPNPIESGGLGDFEEILSDGEVPF